MLLGSAHSEDKATSLSPEVKFREAVFSGYRTGALDIVVRNRRVISVPSQIGCRVGCTFCVSRDMPVVRNLRANKMLEMVRKCLAAFPADGRRLELSFTGEGEPLLNWRETQKVVHELASLSSDFDSVRYCFSGLGASRLLGVVEAGPYPMRLQFSLHAARQSVRDSLVPRSEPLGAILAALRANRHRYASVELNVVLQDGVNDSEQDLKALMHWGDPSWPVLLNPLLSDGEAQIASRTDEFEQRLRRAGRQVNRYAKVATRISRDGIYSLMSARPLIPAPRAIQASHDFD